MFFVIYIDRFYSGETYLIIWIKKYRAELILDNRVDSLIEEG